MALDTVFFALTFLLDFLLIKMLIKKISGINLVELETASKSQLDVLLSDMQSYYHVLIIYLVLFSVLFFLLWCALNSLVYNIILKKKFNFDYHQKSSIFAYYKKFLLLNFIWSISIAIFIYIAIKIFQGKFLLAVLFLFFILAIHLTNALYVVFTLKNEIKKSIKATYDIAIKKIHLFIIPYFFVLVTLVVLFIILFLISKIPAAGNYLGLVLIPVFIAWFRFYTADLILSVQKLSGKKSKRK